MKEEKKEAQIINISTARGKDRIHLRKFLARTKDQAKELNYIFKI